MRQPSAFRLALILGLPLAAPTAPPAAAATLYVDINGLPAGTCLYGDPCPSIATAVGMSAPGDVVEVAGGNYAEHGILVPHSLAIIGAAPSAPTPTVVDAGGADRVFAVNAPNSLVLLSRLTLTHGDAGLATGGAILLSAGDLVVTGSRLLDNDALAGGAIAQESGGALWIFTSFLEDNGSSAAGGAVYCDSCGGIVVRLSALRRNVAGSTGGAIHVEDSILEISQSALSDNVADKGGAINANDSPLAVRDSSLMRNEADALDGGAIYAAYAYVEIQRSTLAENAAFTNGGALVVEGPVDVDVSNSTFSGNSAVCGGAVSLLEQPYVPFSGPAALMGASTFYDNTSSSAFCGAHFQSAANGFGLHNSIVAGGFGSKCNVPMTSGSNNLVDDASCDFGGAPNFNLGAVTGLDPVLAYNGGAPALTHLIDAASNAVEAGNNLACKNPASGNPLTIDQRGLTRPVDYDGDGVATCDVGAVELQ
jgi:hypothetical protein